MWLGSVWCRGGTSLVVVLGRLGDNDREDGDTMVEAVLKLVDECGEEYLMFGDPTDVITVNASSTN